MSEIDRRRYPLAELEEARVTAIGIVVETPKIPMMLLSDRFHEIAEKAGMSLPYGPGKWFANFEDFAHHLSNHKSGLLKRSGRDGHSTFETTQQGSRFWEIRTRTRIFSPQD